MNRWDSTSYALVETGWFDFESRPKTFKALRVVTERLSDDELEELLAKIGIVFAPAPGKHGEVYPFVRTFAAGSHVEVEMEEVLVYLSPEIERRSQAYVTSVVAHEFAHVLLHPQHPHADLPSGDRNAEREADAKIVDWGFAPAYKEDEYLR